MRQGNNSRRSRGRGNGKRQSRGNQIDSHGPEVRVRGTAQQVCDKYLALARDATSSGDRISAENMFQHAEHYSRVLALAQENSEQRNDNRDGEKSRPERDNNGQKSAASQETVEFEPDENGNASEGVNDTPVPNDETETSEEDSTISRGSDKSDKKVVNTDDKSSKSSSESTGEEKQATL